MQVDSKHMKESSTSLIIRKLRAVGYHFSCISKDQKFGDAVGKSRGNRPLHTCFVSDVDTCSVVNKLACLPKLRMYILSPNTSNSGSVF